MNEREKQRTKIRRVRPEVNSVVAKVSQRFGLGSGSLCFRRSAR